MQSNDPLPDLTLPDLDGHPHRLADLRGRVVVINFWSAECPWSARADAQITGWLHNWGDAVAYLPIASNANESDDALRTAALQRGVPFVLRDAGGGAADRFEAQTTPHAFVFSPEGLLRYAGAVDDVTFRKKQPDAFYLRDAVNALLRGEDPPLTSAPPYGCTITRQI